MIFTFIGRYKRLFDIKRSGLGRKFWFSGSGLRVWRGLSNSYSKRTIWRKTRPIWKSKRQVYCESEYSQGDAKTCCGYAPSSKTWCRSILNVVTCAGLSRSISTEFTRFTTLVLFWCRSLWMLMLIQGLLTLGKPNMVYIFGWLFWNSCLLGGELAIHLQNVCKMLKHQSYLLMRLLVTSFNTCPFCFSLYFLIL